MVSGEALTATRGSVRILQCGKGNHEDAGPSVQLLSWAAETFGDGARVVAVRPLHSGIGPWLLGVEHRRGRSQVVLRGPTSRSSPEGIICNAQALQTAARHALPAPQLLRIDRDGSKAGAVATVERVVAGTSDWPAPTTRDRLQAAGAAIAATHRISLAASRFLPYRPRPIACDDFAADRRAGRMPTTPLLRAADERVPSDQTPADPTCFVHGDVWPGNMIWSDRSVCTLIDWKTAGVGDPGVDLAELRKQVAITFGEEAPAQVLSGWERASGTRAIDLAYWDAVAALNTPTRLDTPTATDRRDAFLRAALSRL